MTLTTEADQTLLSLGMECDEFGSQLCRYEVEAFKPGDWIHDILVCQRELKAYRQIRDVEQRYTPEKITDLRKRFDLD